MAAPQFLSYPPPLCTSARCMSSVRACICGVNGGLSGIPAPPRSCPDPSSRLRFKHLIRNAWAVHRRPSAVHPVCRSPDGPRGQRAALQREAAARESELRDGLSRCENVPSSHHTAAILIGMRMLSARACQARVLATAQIRTAWLSRVREPPNTRIDAYRRCRSPDQCGTASSLGVRTYCAWGCRVDQRTPQARCGARTRRGASSAAAACGRRARAATRGRAARTHASGGRARGGARAAAATASARRFAGGSHSLTRSCPLAHPPPTSIPPIHH